MVKHGTWLPSYQNKPIYLLAPSPAFELLGWWELRQMTGAHSCQMVVGFALLEGT